MQESYNDWYAAEDARQRRTGTSRSATRARSGCSRTRSTTAAPAPCTRSALEVGDEAFFAGTQLWLERYDDSAGTAEDFQAVFEEVSGEDLDAFFQIWLYDQAKPPATWTLP